MPNETLHLYSCDNGNGEVLFLHAKSAPAARAHIREKVRAYSSKTPSPFESWGGKVLVEKVIPIAGVIIGGTSY